ncbi:MAG: archease [Saprospiraceae bacterium]|nr:archease [Saprospiraceae bacterium]
MRQVRHFSHTADIRIQVEADSLEELFLAGASVISDLLKPDFCQEHKAFSVLKKIDVRSPDITALMIDFLSDLLTHSYTSKSIFCHIEMRRLTDQMVNATISGCPVDGFDEDIKAVTYHEANILKNKSGNWETMLILDI